MCSGGEQYFNSNGMPVEGGEDGRLLGRFNCRPFSVRESPDLNIYLADRPVSRFNLGRRILDCDTTVRSLIHPLPHPLRLTHQNPPLRLPPRIPPQADSLPSASRLRFQAYRAKRISR